MPAISDPAVVDALQASHRLHLSQAEMYQAQADHFERWGYLKLAKLYAEYADEERGHAKMLSDRIEFWDVQPDYTHTVPEWPRHDFEGILEVDYAADVTALGVERGGYATSVAASDPTSAKIFQKLAAGSEESMTLIEAAQRTISQIGIDNYLANQVLP